jgi:hypothetical protein
LFIGDLKVAQSTADGVGSATGSTADGTAEVASLLLSLVLGDLLRSRDLAAAAHLVPDVDEAHFDGRGGSEPV